MTTTTHPITDRDQWLAQRAQDITSTEIAALYGLSPYVTEFELWHQKRDNFVVALEPDERVRWGTRLQDAIAAGIAEDRGWKVRRFDSYMRDSADRIGSSFDFLAETPDRGTGLMETKNVDRFVFLEDWLDLETGIEAPQHIELQVQHQMEVAGMPWCAIAPLVGGNDGRLTIRERDHEIGQDIRRKARRFWQSIAAGTPPKPDYSRDAEFLCRLHGRADANLTIDADAEVADWIARYEAIGEISEEKKALKARIFERIGKASRVRTSFGMLSCGEVKASAGTEITPDMVGQRTGARAGFRMFRFTEAKKKP